MLVASPDTQLNFCLAVCFQASPLDRADRIRASAALCVSPERYLLSSEIKNATDFTSEIYALSWLSLDKSYSLSKLLLRLFKFTVIAQLSAAQQRIGSQVPTDLRRLLPPDYNWWFLARGDYSYTFISMNLLFKPSLNKWLCPWHSLYLVEGETIFLIVTQLCKHVFHWAAVFPTAVLKVQKLSVWWHVPFLLQSSICCPYLIDWF